MSVVDPAELDPRANFDSSPFLDELGVPSPDTDIRVADDLPWAPEVYAYNQVAISLGITEEHIDYFPVETKRFWAALVSAVASCNVGIPGGEVTVLSGTELKDLYDLATAEGEEGTRFLQQFALETTQNRRLLFVAAGKNVPRVNASVFYARAMNDFLARHRSGRSFID